MIVVQPDAVDLHAGGEGRAGRGAVVVGAQGSREGAVGEGGVVRFFRGGPQDLGRAVKVAGPVLDRELEALACVCVCVFFFFALNFFYL